MPSLPTATDALRARTRRTLVQGRLLLAIKTALAAAIAWWIAQRIPGGAAQYPYYAPLGAVASMYPTIAGSARQGLETLLGLAAGFALALPIIFLGDVSVLSLAAVVGVGVLIAGIPRFGAGRDWIPMAAIFVLLVGGNDPGEYSFSYLLQMLVGVTVGLAVNLLVFPPLHLDGAIRGLQDFRSTLARQLADMSAAITESWPPEHEEWSERSHRIQALGTEVRNAVQLADTSRRGNPRSRKHRHDLEADYNALRAMERIGFHLQDMTEVLTDVIWHTPESTPLAPTLVKPLAHAMALTGRVVDKWDPESTVMTEAEEAVESLLQQINRSAARDERVQATATMGMGLRRILLTVRAEAGAEAGADTAKS